MTDGTLYRLLTWTSPAYPTGAYTYSHGLEFAVEAGLVHDLASSTAWVRHLIEHGVGRRDAIILYGVMTASTATSGGDGHGSLADWNALARALAATSETALETEAQGDAFLRVSRQAWPHADLDRWLAHCGGEPIAFPVAFGLVAGLHRAAPEATVLAYLHALSANAVSAAVRLVPLGQTDGQRLQAALADTVAQRVADTLARVPDLDDDRLASACPVIDWASMAHETQYSRLFRS